MGLFGNRQGWADALQVLGATLKDVSDPEGNALQGVAKMREARARQAQQQALISQLPQYLGQGGGSAGGLPASLLAQLALSGVKGVDTLATLRGQDMPNINVDSGSGRAYNQKDGSIAGQTFARPTVVNDVLINASDPNNIERHIPKVGEGMTYGRDATGRAVGVQVAPGYVDALSAITGAKSGAEAAGSAPYDFINTPTPTGAPQVRSKATAAGGVFTGQSAPEAAQAAAATQAKIGLPQAAQSAQSALKLIDQIRNHPGRQYGVGALGVLPGIPGTVQKDFVSLVDQAKGKAFLEAFASLKGGGAISEVEGQKGTQAIARLDRAQSQQGFDQALNDLQSVIQAGYQRTQAQAGGGKSNPSANYTPAQIQAEIARRRAAGMIP